MFRPPAPPPQPPMSLPYRKPQLGRDYWVADDVLPDPMAIRQRALAREDWIEGYPFRPEPWPGVRCENALTPEEMAHVEAWVMKQTGAKRLWQERAPDGATLNHNVIQVVGGKESGPRPHTDSKKLCRYAAVIYLTPDAPEEAGTTFFRLRLPNGTLSGNLCPAPHANLREALPVPKLPLTAWKEELTVPNKFNRILLYRADLVHSATGYFGTRLENKRMTALFFWMA